MPDSPSSFDPLTVSTLGDLWQAVRDALDDAAIAEAERHADWMVEATTGARRAERIAFPERTVRAVQVAQAALMVERRLTGEPVHYIIGEADFYGLTLRVTPDVLIPRPETEEVVEEALGRVRDLDAPAVLDVGTGSGGIALAIQHARPDAAVSACDVSSAALAVARANARRLDLPARFVHADVLADGFAAAVGGPFDLLISNPPYIPDAEAPTLDPTVRDFEPALALFSGEDALRFYRALAQQAPRVLRPGGWVVAETHAEYAGDVLACWEAEGLKALARKRDLAGRWRIAVGRLS